MLFISIDGVDGCGKSTQVARLAEWLQERGCRVATCRDPGATPLGEAVRGLLLDRHDLQIDLRGEMLLYMAARAQLVQQVIVPALRTGMIVVCDRYLLANVVYQGHAGGLGAQTVWRVGRVATGGLMPDLTVVLDLPVERAAERLGADLDRMERRGAEFQKRVREGFLQEARRGRPPWPRWWHSGSQRAQRLGCSPGEVKIHRPVFALADAEGSVEQVQAEIRRLVAPLLG